MVIAHTASASWHHFHPWITENMDVESVSHFATPNTDKSQKGLQIDSQEPPQMDPKIDKIGLLDLQVPGWCPFGILDHQNGQSGHQNGASRPPK